MKEKLLEIVILSFSIFALYLVIIFFHNLYIKISDPLGINKIVEISNLIDGSADSVKMYYRERDKVIKSKVKDHTETLEKILIIFRHQCEAIGEYEHSLVKIAYKGAELSEDGINEYTASVTNNPCSKLELIERDFEKIWNVK